MKDNMIFQVIILFFLFYSVSSFHPVPGFTRRTIELKELSTPFVNHRVGHKILKLNKGVLPLELSKPSMVINGKMTNIPRNNILNTYFISNNFSQKEEYS